MILAISRFRVVNGLEAEVRTAFARRPRLVDDVPGFLGMETFTDSNDPSVFVLVTRWTDSSSLRAWHSSEAHGRSHAGIPRGLKLDPAFTEVVVLDRLDDPSGCAALEVLAADSPGLVAAFLTRARTTHLFTGTLDGTLGSCNEAAAEGLGLSPTELRGRPIWGFLLEPDQAALRARLVSGHRRHVDVRLNLVGPSATAVPHTLECVLEVGDGFTLLGEAPVRGEHEALAELVRVGSELSVLARENTRVRRNLEQALADLREAHWHVKKLQEVLPMCLDCGQVRTADARWETPRKFLQESATFLSHGYCPECSARVKARFAAGGD